MDKKYILDEYEQEIEDSIDKLEPLENSTEEIAMLTAAAKEYMKAKKSITLRVKESDLEAMRIKASKHGLPYQTYICMLIHKDAMSI